MNEPIDSNIDTEFPGISLCMIAKNEEEWIGQAIQSVQPIVSEIILVDTGSNDRTIEIAESLGAKIFQRPWDDDFSAPRNLSIEKAGGDWILVLDADEAIAAADHMEIKRLTLSRGVCYEIIQRHYSNDQRMSSYSPCRGRYPEWERSYGGFFDSNCCRLFPHHEGLHYQNRIHELVEPSIMQLGRHRIVKTGIVVHHYGHTDQVRAKKTKSHLYTALGEQKTVEQPEAWKNHFELGVEHNCNGRREESVLAFRKAVELNPQYLPSWTNMGYVLCELGRYDEAIDALNHALALDPRDPEAHCNIGVVYMRQHRWIFAEAHLRKAIELKPDYVNAQCNLGQTLIHANQLPAAVEVLTKAVDLLPCSATAKADLGSAYLAMHNYQKALGYLQAATQENPQLSRAFYYLGQAYRATHQNAQAVTALERFCALEVENAAEMPAQMRDMIAAIRNECEFLRKL